MLESSNDTIGTEAPKVENGANTPTYARAQVALMPTIRRTVQYKQKAFEEVSDVAKTHSVPVSDLLAWFQAATSL